MKRAVALGFFDGVHIGHGALLEKTCAVAEEYALSPCVMTYKNHPSEILLGKSVPLINTPDERCHLISSLYGITDIVMKDFTKEYAALSCEEFFENILIGELDAAHVVAGYDFRFGRGGMGDAKTLKELCLRYGLGCSIVDEVSFGGDAVSSSRIRSLLSRGLVSEANELLGHPHCTISHVIRGNGIGRTLDFPTANQRFSADILIPKYGVYASRTTVDGASLASVTNVGTRPTVSEEEEVFSETHIPDFSGNLYGKPVKVELLRFLREEKKFSSRDELLRQISQDVLEALREN